jgi:hypothetical protein
METINFVVRNPFDMEYQPSTAELSLTCVDTLGSPRELRLCLDPYATCTLCDLLGAAIAQNSAPLGRPTDAINFQ